MNKPVYLGLAILELSKILIYEIWYDYVKLKCGEKSKWCYIDTEIFIVYIKQMILQKMLKLDQILQIMLKRPLLNGKSKKVVGLMKDELGRKILTKICWTKSKNLQLLNR